jgi:hypothetical protein
MSSKTKPRVSLCQITEARRGEKVNLNLFHSRMKIQVPEIRQTGLDLEFSLNEIFLVGILQPEYYKDQLSNVLQKKFPQTPIHAELVEKIANYFQGHVFSLRHLF